MKDVPERRPRRTNLISFLVLPLKESRIRIHTHLCHYRVAESLSGRSFCPVLAADYQGSKDAHIRIQMQAMWTHHGTAAKERSFQRPPLREMWKQDSTEALFEVFCGAECFHDGWRQFLSGRYLPTGIGKCVCENHRGRYRPDKRTTTVRVPLEFVHRVTKRCS